MQLFELQSAVPFLFGGSRGILEVRLGIKTKEQLFKQFSAKVYRLATLHASQTTGKQNRVAKAQPAGIYPYRCFFFLFLFPPPFPPFP